MTHKQARVRTICLFQSFEEAPLQFARFSNWWTYVTTFARLSCASMHALVTLVLAANRITFELPYPGPPDAFQVAGAHPPSRLAVQRQPLLAPLLRPQAAWCDRHASRLTLPPVLCPSQQQAPAPWSAASPQYIALLCSTRPHDGWRAHALCLPRGPPLPARSRPLGPVLGCLTPVGWLLPPACPRSGDFHWSPQRSELCGQIFQTAAYTSVVQAQSAMRAQGI